MRFRRRDVSVVDVIMGAVMCRLVVFFFKEEKA